MEPVPIYNDSYYIRLNSNYQSKRSAVVNTVSDFENVLHTSVQLDHHRVGLVDLHINGQLDSNGLKTRKDFTLSITEYLPTYNEIMSRTFNARYLKDIPIMKDYARYLHAIYTWENKSVNNYATYIYANTIERDFPIRLRIDIVLKTAFHNDTIEKIHTIRNDPDIKVEIEDDEIQEMVEAELTNLEKFDTIVTYTYDG